VSPVVVVFDSDVFSELVETVLSVSIACNLLFEDLDTGGAPLLMLEIVLGNKCILCVRILVAVLFCETVAN